MGHSISTWPIFLWSPPQNLVKYSTFVCTIKKLKILKIIAFLIKEIWSFGLQKFWAISAWRWFLSFRPFLRAYNCVGIKAINLKFSMLNNLTKDFQKIDIWGYLVFPWLQYWTSKIKKTFFLNFVMFWLSNTSQIVKIY